jgi:hypothetical protein
MVLLLIYALVNLDTAILKGESSGDTATKGDQGRSRDDPGCQYDGKEHDTRWQSKAFKFKDADIITRDREKGSSSDAGAS